MKTAAGDFQIVMQALRGSGLLLESDATLPSVAGLIAKEPIKGSWWTHARSHDIFKVLGEFADHSDVIFTKLISGKVTLVHRKLWPEIFAIGEAREVWQMKTLSRSARSLLDMVDQHGSIRTDALDWPKNAPAKLGDAARELEKKLLVSSAQFHGESGAHVKLLEGWKVWAKRMDFKPKPISAEDSKRKFEEILEKLNSQFGAKGTLPWV